ncbi:MAG: coproporphyrinogen dehydrogenase HemZ [Lachnospiraceae bacterium]|nr:coproporphyrinogen dehydrogenase HemZ [Lachnospiraceae bacterium]
MIYVYIKKELAKFETDIRDLCLAFFTLQKITYIIESNTTDESIDTVGAKPCEPQIANDDIVVNDYYTGALSGDRLQIKSELKRQLYNYLSKLTGKTLLWGTLTGIRPVNIVTKIIEDLVGNPLLTDDYIRNELKKEYYISDLKANELIRIAKKEIEILNRPEVKDYKKSYSIYVGVPFCKSTCLYCSFTSFNIEKFSKYVDTYLETLEKDFKSRIASIGGKALTLYIGGGTPTSLNEEQFERLLTIIDKYVDKSKCIEYTVEAGRPDTITKEKLIIMKKHGVTRISINPQSFNQRTLDLIGRKHTVKDVIKKFKLARSLGFDNINMDIILGLPNEHLLNVLKTLNGIRKLKPDSFTVHSLALKRAARLNFELDSWTKNYYLAGLGNQRRAKFCEPEGRREIDKMFKWSEYLAKYLNLHPYYLYRQKNMAGNLENVGYAKDGKECVYNIMMMSERHTVYGFGTATTKKVFYENDGSKRIESEEGYKSVIDYCKSFDTI